MRKININIGKVSSGQGWQNVSDVDFVDFINSKAGHCPDLI
jgi:hypothetical protein